MARSKRLLAAGLTALISFTYFWALHAYGINLPDEGTLLYKFARAADGQRIYVDFHAGYTPGVFYVHSFLQGMYAQSIMPGRIALAVVNSAAVAMLFLLVVPACGSWCAAAAALLYAAFMPVHPGYFASFNVPYPSWYAVAIFLGGLLAARAYVEHPTTPRAFLVGVLAGCGFLFKPNVGALQLACAMLLVLSAVPRRGRSFARLWWWIIWSAVLIGVLFMFGGRPGALEMRTFILPIAAAGVLCAIRAGDTTRGHATGSAIASTLALVVGFCAVSLPWLGYYATQVPLSTLLSEVLFIGTGYAGFFYLPHPSVLAEVALMALGFAVLGLLPQQMRSSTVSLSRVAVTALAAAYALALILATSQPMVQGFLFSVTSRLEAGWACALTLAAIWLLLAVAFSNAGTDPTMLVLAVGAAALYATNYPRADFMHWIWAAPVAIAGGVVLLSALSDAWSPTAGRSGYLRAVVLAPLVLTGGMLVATALASTYRLNGITPTRRANIELENDRAPVWMNIGRAENYRDLERVVDAIDRVSRPDDLVFTFPALDIVAFLAHRDSPLRDSYFFPRWINHEDEAAAVEQMRKHPPRFAVVLREHWAYFDQAPAYYALLGSFLDREYRPYVRAGRFVLLAHRSVTEPPPPNLEVAIDAPDERLDAYLHERLDGRSVEEAPSVLRDLRYDGINGYYPQLAALLSHNFADVRTEAVRTLISSGDDRTAVALFNGASDGTLQGGTRLLALRLAGAWAGHRTAEAALPFVTAEDPDLRNAARTAVGSYVDYRLEASLWPGWSESSEPRWRFDERERARIADWLRNPLVDARLKSFAILVAPETGGIADIIEELARACPDEQGTLVALDASDSAGIVEDCCATRSGAALSKLTPSLALRLQLLRLVDEELGRAPNPAAARAASELELRLLAYDDLTAPSLAASLLRHVPDPAAIIDVVTSSNITDTHRERMEYVRSLLAQSPEVAR